MVEKYEQLEIMKVIEFPKNRQYENKIRNEKLNVAIKILELLNSEGCDFRIVINKNAALEIFDLEDYQKEYLILTTSSFEKDRHFKADATNAELHAIQGNEVD